LKSEEIRSQASTETYHSKKMILKSIMRGFTRFWNKANIVIFVLTCLKL